MECVRTIHSDISAVVDSTSFRALVSQCASAGRLSPIQENPGEVKTAALASLEDSAHGDKSSIRPGFSQLCPVVERDELPRRREKGMIKCYYSVNVC